MMTPLRSVSRDAKALRAHARRLHWRDTPNPLARELVLAPGKLLLPRDDAVLRLQKQPVFEVAQAFQAALHAASPLVAKLVGVEDVDEVLLGADRVTVKICDLHGSWDDVGPRVKEIVREALRCGPMPASALAELHELLGAEATPPPEKVSLEEHIRRMLAEGAETSIVWSSSVGSVGDAHRG